MSESRITFSLTAEHRTAYDRLGLLRLPGAVDPAAAHAMADVLWRALERKFGIRRDARETWTVRNPSGLGPAGRTGEFAMMASPVVTGILDQLLGPGWIQPTRWGVPLVTFPDAGSEWDVPHAHWHLDTPATPEAPAIARVFVLLAPLRPRGGGTLVVAGSHLLFQRLAKREGRAVRSADAKQLLFAEQDWFAALASAACGCRTRRFMEEGAMIEGAEVRVVEMTGDPGDAFFMHPSLLHTPSRNVGESPRLMLTQWIDGKR